MVDFNRIQRLHMSKINLLKKIGKEANLSVAIWEGKGESNPELAGLNQQNKTLKTPKINPETSNVGKRMRVFISEQLNSGETAHPKTFLKISLQF